MHHTEFILNKQQIGIQEAHISVTNRPTLDWPDFATFTYSSPI